MSPAMSDDDMWPEFDAAHRRGEEVRGWVAMHQQDVDSVVDSGVLCLAFAAPTGNDDDLRAIGLELADASRTAGDQSRLGRRPQPSHRTRRPSVAETVEVKLTARRYRRTPAPGAQIIHGRERYRAPARALDPALGATSPVIWRQIGRGAHG